MLLRSFGRAAFLGLVLCALASAADPTTNPASRPASRPTSAPAALDIDLKSRAPDPAKDPLPFVAGSWTLVVVPDVQNYNDNVTRAKYAKERAMLQWIALNKDRRNIRFLTTLGDITNHNIALEWEAARLAFSVFDGVLPYAMVTGNHDYSRYQTLLNDYFKPADNHLNDPARGGALGGTMVPDAIENAWYSFRVNNQTYLLMTAEYRPRNMTLEWANKVMAEHKDARAIFVTHSYLNYDDTRLGRGQKGTSQSPNAPNDGELVWQRLISKHPNFIMTLNGHVLGDATGYLASKGEQGNTVHQMVYNRQHKDDGQLRLMEFLPDNKTVQVKTYSPVTDEWARDNQNEYILDLSPAEGAPTSRPARP